MLPSLILIPLVALFRIFLAWMPAGSYSLAGLTGACPLSAAALCAGIFLPRRLALVVPLGILFLSDIAINLHYRQPFVHESMPGRYAVLALVGLFGMWLHRKRRTGLASVLLATVGGSVFFYAGSNTLLWLGNPGYPQTAAGLWQSLTTGLPGWPPSYVFFRNGLVSDLLYSMVFVACVRLASAPRLTPGVNAVPVDAPRL